MKCFACDTEPSEKTRTCECGGTRLPSVRSDDLFDVLVAIVNTAQLNPDRCMADVCNDNFAVRGISLRAAMTGDENTPLRIESTSNSCWQDKKEHEMSHMRQTSSDIRGYKPTRSKALLDCPHCHGKQAVEVTLDALGCARWATCLSCGGDGPVSPCQECTKDQKPCKQSNAPSQQT